MGILSLNCSTDWEQIIDLIETAQYFTWQGISVLRMKWENYPVGNCS